MRNEPKGDLREVLLYGRPPPWGRARRLLALHNANKLWVRVLRPSGHHHGKARV